MVNADRQIYESYVAYCERLGIHPAPPEHYFKVTGTHNTVVNYMPQKHVYASREKAAG